MVVMLMVMMILCVGYGCCNDNDSGDDSGDDAGCNVKFDDDYCDDGGNVFACWY